ncbi:MAG: di-trans,poly-cis-decaprenylcistransferase [Phycisphaerales bacterium]|nr:di-trans,poly-cis-decaprenylcistransferase [Phycisphaerales bacterium]
MDGNGRWAQARGLARTAGHAAGAVAARRTVVTCAKLELQALTLYSFSSENWSRPEPEVDALMAIAYERLYSERQTMIDNGIRLRHIGRREGLPQQVLDQLDACSEATQSCKGMTLCLAINYGSRGEIADAAKTLAQRVQTGEITPESINEESLASCLYTAGLPDPDLLIRTAGEMRLSNYLLWQVSYAEILVTPTLWPDFDENTLSDAVAEFARRRRTFGGVMTSSP